MNFWKTTLITAFAFVGISSTVLFTSCEEDACLELKCRNGGACSDGLCRCPAGYEGAECEDDVATKFAGNYYGDSKCGLVSPYFDSANVTIAQRPNLINVVVYNSHSATDTIKALIGADGTSAVYNGAPNNRKVRVSLDNTKRLTVTIDETIDGKNRYCTFNGTK